MLAIYLHRIQTSVENFDQWQQNWSTWRPAPVSSFTWHLSSFGSGDNSIIEPANYCCVHISPVGSERVVMRGSHAEGMPVPEREWFQLTSWTRFITEVLLCQVRVGRQPNPYDSRFSPHVRIEEGLLKKKVCHRPCRNLLVN